MAAAASAECEADSAASVVVAADSGVKGGGYASSSHTRHRSTITSTAVSMFCTDTEEFRCIRPVARDGAAHRPQSRVRGQRLDEDLAIGLGF